MRNDWWHQHLGKLCGLAAGLFLSVVYLISGFWDMLIVGFILFLGLYFGKKADGREPLVDWAFWLERLGERWRWFR